ncbi:uncharacterized protein LOC129746884 isoform X2 [Uranotaenia lowii]|uniref:uncharacterized protein LOC129746884 isoform X2 n=1 Tax=Uranotaenia lowii TaxID=190385 RepID=UPI00247A05FE|nr:uncharacterized protein LOC129746884 isoform X2 [Uranotaenia lowii]
MMKHFLPLIIIVVIVAPCGVLSAAGRRQLRSDVVYNERNHKEGRYKYGYAVKQGESQFHHQRSLDGAMYGCYGYVDPQGKLFITHYLADKAGYRLVNMEDPERRLAESIRSSGSADNPIDLQDLFPTECQSDSSDIKILKEMAEEMQASMASDIDKTKQTPERNSVVQPEPTKGDASDRKAPAKPSFVPKKKSEMESTGMKSTEMIYPIHDEMKNNSDDMEKQQSSDMIDSSKLVGDIKHDANVNDDNKEADSGDFVIEHNTSPSKHYKEPHEQMFDEEFPIDKMSAPVEEKDDLDKMNTEIEMDDQRKPTEELEQSKQALDDNPTKDNEEVLMNDDSNDQKADTDLLDDFAEKQLQDDKLTAVMNEENPIVVVDSEPLWSDQEQTNNPVMDDSAKEEDSSNPNGHAVPMDSHLPMVSGPDDINDDITLHDAYRSIVGSLQDSAPANGKVKEVAGEKVIGNEEMLAEGMDNLRMDAQMAQDIEQSDQEDEINPDNPNAVKTFRGKIKYAHYANNLNKVGESKIEGVSKIMDKPLMDQIHDDSSVPVADSMQDSSTSSSKEVTDEESGIEDENRSDSQMSNNESTTSIEGEVNDEDFSVSEQLLKAQLEQASKIIDEQSPGSLVQKIVPGVRQQSPPITVGKILTELETMETERVSNDNEQSAGEVPSPGSFRAAADAHALSDGEPGIEFLKAMRLPATPRTTQQYNIVPTTYSGTTPRPPMHPRPTTLFKPSISSQQALTVTPDSTTIPPKFGTSVGPGGDIYDEIEEDPEPVLAMSRPSHMKPQVVVQPSSGTSVPVSIQTGSTGTTVEPSSSCYEVILQVPADAKQIIIKTEAEELKAYGSGEPSDRIKLLEPGVYEVNVGATKGIKFEQYHHYPHKEFPEKIELDLGHGFNYGDLVPKPLFSIAQEQQLQLARTGLVALNNPYLPLGGLADPFRSSDEPVETKFPDQPVALVAFNGESPPLTSDQRVLLRLVPSWRKVLFYY